MKLQRLVASTFKYITLLIAMAGLCGYSYLAYAGWNSTGRASGLADALARGDARFVAQLGRHTADVQLLRTATRMQPRLTDAWIEISVIEELRGNHRAARQALVRASQYDAGYQPRWAMANYFLRRNQLDAFWEWAQKCAAVPYADYGPLISLFSRVDLKEAFLKIGPGDARFQRQFVDYALAANHITAGVAAAIELAGRGHAQDRGRLLDYCDRCLAEGNSSAAVRLWDRLVQGGILLHHNRGAAGELLNNPAFTSTPVGRGFDWRIYPGRGSDVVAGNGLHIELTGRQLDAIVLAEQHVAVVPGSLLSLDVNTLSTTIQGLDWVVYPLLDWSKPLGVLAVNSGREAVSLRVPSNVELIRIVLRYRRQTGTVRAMGEARFAGVHLRRLQP